MPETKPWKENWIESRERFASWWQHDGLLLGSWGTGLPRREGPRGRPETPPAPSGRRERMTDPSYVARRIRAEMAAKAWPGDILPLAWPELGTVCLAPALGSGIEYGPDNVWYTSRQDASDPESWGPLAFDPAHPEAAGLEALVREALRVADGDYFVGMPAMIPNLDVLAELRGAGELLLDLYDRPEWIAARLLEIDGAWKTAYDRLYDILKAPDGSMCFGYFMLWGAGKTGLLQCDVAANFSPAMFEEVAIPRLVDECAFLDYSLYHVDGHQCLGDLDAVLALEELDAVEWTPDPQVPPGGDPAWYPMYRRIIEAGKSLWVANLRPGDIAPLLDAVGAKGIYLTVDVPGEDEFDEAWKVVERYRG
jgi:hypothetical protein